jgi:uncharacterized protein YceK
MNRSPIARRRLVALLLLGLLPAGCGTAANLCRSRTEDGGRVPFGGVKQDLECLKKATNGELREATPAPESEQYPQRVLLVFSAIDLPFSLVGDVVTWPYTAAYTFINRPVPTPPVLIAPPEVPPPALPPDARIVPRKLP